MNRKHNHGFGTVLPAKSFQCFLTKKNKRKLVFTISVNNEYQFVQMYVYLLSSYCPQCESSIRRIREDK